MTLFGTAGIRGAAVDGVTPELALRVGRAAAVHARDHDELAAFVVGRDGRVTGAAIVDAVVAGLQSGGVPVSRVGQVPTPALAFASQDRRGIMVTASHNPPGDTGIKLFVDGVEYDGGTEDQIADRVESEPDPVRWSKWTSSTRETVVDQYRDTVVDYATRYGDDLDGLDIVVDCGNGTASLGTPQVLDSLGASVVTLHGNVDGYFPGRRSKPTPASLAGCRRFIDDGDFDLGIAHDGDGDRLVVLNAAGDIVHEDTIVAIIASHLVEHSPVDEPVVVTTPNASARIDDRVEAVGGRTTRTALGTLHEGIAAVQDSGGSVVFAAEPWKHIHPGLGGWIDGVASAALIARLVAMDGLESLRAPVTERPYRKRSLDCPDSAKPAVMARLEEVLPPRFADAELNTDHGVRVTRADGSWVLVRPSGTESKVRIYVEADDAESLLADVTAVVTSIIEEET